VLDVHGWAAPCCWLPWPATLDRVGGDRPLPDRGQAATPACPRRDAGPSRQACGHDGVAITCRIAARRLPPRAHVAAPGRW